VFPADVRAAVETALGTNIESLRVVSGGDINDAHAAKLGDGRDVFIKTNRSAEASMFPCEARGLRWLGEPDALPVPKVLAVNDDDADACFLVLEHLPPVGRAPHFDRTLGSGLATLHAFGAESFGLDYDNFIADLHQPNRPLDTWPSFYAKRRLGHQVRLAVDRGRAPASWTATFDELFAKLPDLCGDAEPPSRLHGDLWSGNLHTTPSGGPCLIDPAVYGGHREIDLAMLSLFGSPGPDFWSAYDEAYPLSDGWRERVPLYQLYPLLVHVNLFGGSYIASVEGALSRYL
jgi:fructosamine-3-kinase